MSNVNPASNGRAEVMLLQRFESDLLTREQAAAYLGIASRTLAMWKWAKRYTAPIILQNSPSLCLGHSKVTDTKCHVH